MIRRPRLLSAAAVLILVLLLAVVADLGDGGEIARLDAAVSGAVAGAHVSPLSAVALWITQIGAEPSLAAVALVSTLFLWAHGRGVLVAPLWLTFGGAMTTTWAGKYAIDRPRPVFTDLASALSPSFPSGHATGAVALFGFVAYAVARGLGPGPARFHVAIWMALLIVLIAASRVLLSVHYVSDVLAGLLVGGLWLLIGIAAAERRKL